MTAFELMANQEFESSYGETAQWKRFYSSATRYLRGILKDVATDIKFTKGHFYFSGFLTRKKDGQVIYISTSDFRDISKTILIRRAKDYKDFIGGLNNFVSISNNFKELFIKVVENV